MTLMSSIVTRKGNQRSVAQLCYTSPAYFEVALWCMDNHRNRRESNWSTVLHYTWEYRNSQLFTHINIHGNVPSEKRCVGAKCVYQPYNKTFWLKMVDFISGDMFCGLITLKLNYLTRTHHESIISSVNNMAVSCCGGVLLQERLVHFVKYMASWWKDI